VNYFFLVAVFLAVLLDLLFLGAFFAVVCLAFLTGMRLVRLAFVVVFFAFFVVVRLVALLGFIGVVTSFAFAGFCIFSFLS